MDYTNRFSTPVSLMGVLQIEGTLTDSGPGGDNLFLLQGAGNSKSVTVQVADLIQGEVGPIHILGAQWTPTFNFDMMLQHYARVQVSVASDSDVLIEADSITGNFSDLGIKLTVFYANQS